MTKADIASLPSIASASMLGYLNISVWEARKKDKKTEAEVTASKGARSKRAASVHKHLFSECPALEAIKALRGEARQWFNRVTLPWDDNGGRLIVTKNYFEVMADAARYEKRFDDLVQVFCNTYATEISKQAFEMGALFDRNEYPDVADVRHKFDFSLSVNPLPMAGDFRLDIANDALTELQKRHEKQTQARVAAAMSDAWTRIKEQVQWVHERMSAVLDHDPDATEETQETDDQGNVTKVEIKKKRRPKLYDSMLEQGIELCGLLRDLNVTNDPALEEARRMLESTLVRIDMDSLKESPELQRSTKAAMQSIIDKFAL
mgnify:CR=1 FL=1